MNTTLVPRIAVAGNECIDDVLGEEGYTRRLSLNREELETLHACIRAQWLGNIRAHDSALAAQAELCGMSRYHELCDRLDHPSLWPKERRILPQVAVEQLKRMPFFSRVRDAFGPFGIAQAFYGDTHVAGLEEIYWRLVRPNAAGDVGDLHADYWFHQMMGMHGRAFPTCCFTLKVWIPVITEPARNGLLLVPGSHLRDWKYSIRWINGQPKPKFEDSAEPILVPTEPGEALIFHERLLHGGAVNRGQHTRVSAEITLVFESEAVLRYRATRS